MLKKLWAFFWSKYLFNSTAKEWGREEHYDRVVKVTGWRSALVDSCLGSGRRRVWCCPKWMFWEYQTTKKG